MGNAASRRQLSPRWPSSCFQLEPTKQIVRHVTDTTPEGVEENVLQHLHEAEVGAKRRFEGHPVCVSPLRELQEGDWMPESGLAYQAAPCADASGGLSDSPPSDRSRPGPEFTRRPSLSLSALDHPLDPHYRQEGPESGLQQDFHEHTGERPDLRLETAHPRAREGPRRRDSDIGGLLLSGFAVGRQLQDTRADPASSVESVGPVTRPPNPPASTRPPPIFRLRKAASRLICWTRPSAMRFRSRCARRSFSSDVTNGQ